MKQSEVKAGDVVEVTFWDHVEDSHLEGDGKPLQCRVWGRVARKSKDHLLVACWDYATRKGKPDHNVKTFSILCNAIIYLDKLK